MTKKKPLLLFCALASLFCLPLQAVTPPKLIVAILVDQLRYDYLERFQEHFSTNGFRLFIDRGAFMSFAHYNYVPTVTGPGHASYLSGGTPMMHGIIANEWYDRKSGKDIGCVEDQSVDGVGATAGKGRSSPRNFVGDNFADELRLHFQSKVVSLSMKDRGAILPGGKKPTGAYWYHSKNGNFITSTYYREQLPTWVKDFNSRKLPAEYMGKTWDRLLDAKFYNHSDDNAWEENLSGEKKPTFPHTIAKSKDSFENIEPSPYSNQLLEELAEAAIEGEKLGQDAKPDLLCVSFSAMDAVGHRFGPYSHEAQDLVLRLDRQLEKLFNYIDQKVGLTNVLVTLTADHAVAPVPEYAKEHGLDGQRLNETDFLGDLKEHLSEEFGPGRYLVNSKIYSGQIYLNYATLQKKKLEVATVASSIREFVLASGKYQACFTREQLLDGRAPGLLGQLAYNGYNAERGGDLVLMAKPFTIPGSGKTGSTHGSAFSYDTHVPVLFYGPAIRPGRYADDFKITDIVPTLCAAIGMTEPAGNMGKPLVRLLQTNP